MKKKILKYLIIIASINYSFAQKTDFIVKSNNDTINVDKINLKFDFIKVKINGKKKKYDFTEIKSFYDSKKKFHYEKAPSPFEIHKEYTNGKFFLHRLTNGKVKLFNYYKRGQSIGGIPTSIPGLSLSFNNSKNSYYIAIYDSKLELLNTNRNLKLTKDIYEILKIYLYGNNEIKHRLDKLFLSKPIVKEEKIIDLVNEYNIWVKSNN
jgi:hypothetical protein